MWPFKKKEVIKEIIYDNTVYVEAYTYPNHYNNVPIVTYVVKTTKGKKVSFDLVCDYGLNDSAFLTSEHASNGRICQIAKCERAKAKKFIEEYKCKNNID